MPISEALMAAALAGRLSTEDYEQRVRTQVETATRKPFADITSDELASVKINGPLQMKSACSKLVKEKRNAEFIENRKKDFEAAYAKWDKDKKPADMLRHARGGIIGIVGAG